MPVHIKPNQRMNEWMDECSSFTSNIEYFRIQKSTPLFNLTNRIKKKATRQRKLCSPSTKQSNFGNFDAFIHPNKKKHNTFTHGGQKRQQWEVISIVAISRTPIIAYWIYFWLARAENLPYCVNATAQNNCQLVNVNCTATAFDFWLFIFRNFISFCCLFPAHNRLFFVVIFVIVVSLISGFSMTPFQTNLKPIRLFQMEIYLFILLFVAMWIDIWTTTLIG